MLNKGQMYIAALAAALIGAGGFAFAEKSDMKENDAVAVTKAQTSLIQAVTVAEQSAGGKAARAEFVLEDLMPLAEARQIDIGVESAGDFRLTSDPVDLLTLVKNLADNAIRYSPAGGKVDLCARGGGSGHH